MSSFDVDYSAASKRASFNSTSLSHVHIAEALLRSPDNGATLDLTKGKITDVGESGAEELAAIGRTEPEDESSVLRIALGNNHLSTLPMAFALLSRLRYLNLKNNNFSVFPDVLTVMPSLDTLDISHNKIKRLPSQPGSLINLRVFCFSRNKVTRLPLYLTKFRNLTILKVDRNPIDWPPKSVMEASVSLDTPQGMKDWIHNVQRWIEDDIVIEDSGFSEQHEIDHNIEETYNSWSNVPNNSDFDAGVTPHARSFSVGSNLSISSIAESLQEPESPTTFAQPERPPHLHLGILQSYSPSNSPSWSPESYLPSPADSHFSIDENTTTLNDTLSTFQQQQQHGRNASFASGLREPPRSDELAGKKSMPDLRTAKLNFMKKIPDLPERAFPPIASGSNKTLDDFSIPSPLSQRQDSGSSLSSGPRTNKHFATREVAQASPTRAIPSMDHERNSYFRRLSTLPVAVISTTLPPPLICLIDSARSILFAVCQVYQTLEHYTKHAVDDRLASILLKVLDPAAVDMLQLITSLDRFDAMSRKMLPPPAVCRSVVESCKDTVAVFGKAVGVLALQLKVLASKDDVRYMRTMLLVLYGATAEIAYAWQAMVPHIEAIRPLLRAKPYAAHSPTGFLNGTANAEPIPVSAPSTTTLPFQPDPSVPILRSHSATALGVGNASVTIGRTRTARRHAGSFSSKDVELGKSLPSYDDVPSLSGGVISGVATQTPTPRAPKRQHPPPVSSPSPTKSPVVPSSSVMPLGEISRSTHSRHGSQASIQASSSSSSPSLPSTTTFLELPSTSRTQVDKEALHAVKEAVDVAPAVWTMMDEIIGEDANLHVRESLERAKSVTKRLSELIRAMQEGDPTADRKILREDAHVFLKTVVQLSNIIKTYDGAHTVSSALRSNIIKLTNSTEEFAILLHVSSFSPSSTPRPYSPMLSSTSGSGSAGLQFQGGFLAAPEEIRLGSSLSRSRSAQPSSSLKLPVTPIQDGPRSALPTQSFKVPPVRRARTRDARLDPEGPG